MSKGKKRERKSLIMTTIKLLLLLLNLLFLAFGAGLIAQAFLLDAEHNVRPGHSFEKNPYPQNIIVMVISLGVTGGVAIIVAVVACGGIIKEVNFLVMTYAVFMSFFLLAQVVLSLQFAHIRRFEVRKKLHLGLRRWLLNYSPSDSFEVQEIRKNWDSIQYKLNCCGIFDYKDWENVTIPRKEGVTSRPLVPYSCCRKDTDDFMKHRCTDQVDFRKPLKSAERIYTEGCLDKVVDDYRDSTFGMIGWILIVGPVIEFLAFFFACSFSHYIIHGDDDDDDDYDCRRRPSEFCFYPEIANV